MRFAFRLAAQLGVEDPIAMIGRMTPELFDLWIAFDALEPIGQRGTWAQLARITDLQMARCGVESEMADFLPGFNPEE